MSPTQCEPLKIISTSIRKNSHQSAEIPSTHSHHLGGALPVLLLYQTLSRRPEPQHAQDGSWWRTKFTETLEEKQSVIPWEILEILFKHELLREKGSPICNIRCLQLCPPNLKANVFPFLCKSASLGYQEPRAVHAPCFLHPSGPSGTSC